MKGTSQASRSDRFWIGVVAPLASVVLGYLMMFGDDDFLGDYGFAHSWWFEWLVAPLSFLCGILLIRGAWGRAIKVWRGEKPTSSGNVNQLPLPLDGGLDDGWSVVFLAARGRRADVLACLSRHGVEPRVAIGAAYEVDRPVVVGVGMTEQDARALATDLAEAGATVGVVRAEKLALIPGDGTRS